jgi:hypothetical protein
MKKLIVATIVASITLSAFAADKTLIAPSLNTLLRDIGASKNVAKFENTKYELEGYVVRVDSKTENGQKMYLIQMADSFISNARGGYIANQTYNSRMLCVTTDRETAAAFVPNTKVSYTAFGGDIQEIQVLEYGFVRKYQTLISNCQL